MTNEQKLSTLIQCETISSHNQKDLNKFYKFHALLKELYPMFFSVISLEVIQGCLLMKWEGTHIWKDSSTPLNPIMFMSHHDVVEASGEWTHPAFSGTVSDGRLWGRGTLDTKGNLWAMITAAEELITKGFQPTRDYYFVSSCNEETSGEGAQTIVATLKERNITLDLLLDEGGMIIPEPMPGIKGLYAMVGVGEKGCVTLKFTARGNGGHGSSPGKNTPWIQLSKFMLDVENHAVFDTYMNPATKEMLRCFAPNMSGALGILFKNIRLTSGLLTKIMPSVSSTAAALVKTTIAFTMGQGANGYNVIPQEAWIIGDMRFSIHQGKDSSIKAISSIASKYGLETQVVEDGIDSPLTDFQGPMFQLVSDTIHTIYPDVNVAPYIMLGASDSRFFGEICENCIRFAPFVIDTQQLDSIHGIDENVYLSSLAPAVAFFELIMKQL